MEKKDAYICYNSADLNWVESLAEQLESETIDGTPDGRKLEVFFDQWDMDAGESLIDKMNEGMEAARHVITVLSPEFLAADWPRFEWKHIVSADPNNTKGKLIPIMFRDLSLDGKSRIELCAPFRDLKYLDFRRKGDFKKQFGELVRKIRRIKHPRGRTRPSIALVDSSILASDEESETAWSPDNINEHLFSNLFPVKSIPHYIWGQKTRCRKKTEIWDACEKTPPFILKNGLLYTFAKLDNNDNPFSEVTSGEPIRLSYQDWTLDTVQERWLTELLNACLKDHLWKKGIRSDGKGRFYFLPPREGSERPLKTTNFSRKVAKEISNEETGAHFWVHQGSKLKFVRKGDSLFIEVQPLYVFTEDGETSISGKSAGKLAQLWTGKQQNSHILRDILFWGEVLAGRSLQIKILSGDQRIVV
ncbi:MAG: toll/interleukin-1 receptor domain-containing protein, partial [Verrucomicrobiota bacterium]